MFKSCTLCKKIWSDRDSFLRDPAIELIGYQADIDDIEYGLFFFNHNHDQCGTTLSLSVKIFLDLYDGPIYTENLYGTDSCGEHCLHQYDLEPCPKKCACAYIRELLQHLRIMTNSNLCPPPERAPDAITPK